MGRLHASMQILGTTSLVRLRLIRHSALRGPINPVPARVPALMHPQVITSAIQGPQPNLPVTRVLISPLLVRLCVWPHRPDTMWLRQVLRPRPPVPRAHCKQFLVRTPANQPCPDTMWIAKGRLQKPHARKAPTILISALRACLHARRPTQGTMSRAMVLRSRLPASQDLGRTNPGRPVAS